MNKLIKLILITLMPISLFAHSLLLNVYDNGDNTITIDAGFNTGESAAGALVKLQSLNSGKILFEKRLPIESEITVKIPKEAYKIILDGGVGHTITKDGIAPKEGYTKVEKTTKEEKPKEQKSKLGIELSDSNAVNISILVAFLLLLATILISIKNTNKILREIKN